MPRLFLAVLYRALRVFHFFLSLACWETVFASVLARYCPVWWFPVFCSTYQRPTCTLWGVQASTMQILFFLSTLPSVREVLRHTTYLSDGGLRLVVEISFCSPFNIYEFQWYWAIITRNEKRTSFGVAKPNKNIPAE